MYKEITGVFVDVRDFLLLIYYRLWCIIMIYQ